METEVKNYTVSIFTEDQIGLLSQISNIFTRRSLSIWSMSASASELDGIHNITIVTKATERQMIDVVRHLEKRVEVLKAFYYLRDQLVYREMALYKLSTEKMLEYGKVEEMLTRHNAVIVEINKNFTVIQKTGHTHETQELYNELKTDIGVLQFVRSGRVGVSRTSLLEIDEFLKERAKAERELNK